MDFDSSDVVLRVKESLPVATAARKAAFEITQRMSCNGQRCFSYREANIWNDLRAKTK